MSLMRLTLGHYHKLFYNNLEKICISFFLLFFVFQIFFQIKTEYLKPNVHIVPPVPNKYMVQALSLGDEEFYFRALSLKIQNAGDSFGRSTPLKNYNYEELYKWFKFMDTLNDKSRVIPSIAAYYFSQTQNKPDVIHIVNYLYERADANLDSNWWWLYQSVYLARRILEDNNLALKIAYRLSENNDPEAPLWTKQLPAFLHARLGHECEAFFIINTILKDHESGRRELNEEEMNFMRHFIQERLVDFKKTKFDPRKCKKK